MAMTLQEPSMPAQDPEQAGKMQMQQQEEQPQKQNRRSVRILTTYREDDERPDDRIQQLGGAAAAVARSQPKMLKINVDLLLWRCRTARIRARATLDLAERRALMKQAEEGLRRCLALDSSDPRPYVVLGKTLMLQKRYDEARALYQDGCTNTGNTNPYIWSAWGWLEAQTGNADRARKLYDAAVVVDATHACAWHKWGMLEKAQGNYARARDLWMTGIQRCRRKPQSQNAYLYCALGCMAAQLGRVGEARAWFEEGTRSAEGAASVALWQAWAVLETKQGDPAAVRYLFRKSLGANPRSRYVHLAWALWERQQGNMRQCMALLERGCKLNPTDAALYQAWALVEKEAGNLERARQLFEMGLRADPEHLYLWQAFGIMEAQQGNLDRARQLFQEGVWSDPRSKDTVFIFHAWGALEAQAGNHQTARELFKAAIRVDPKSELTWDSWIAMEDDLGFLERADDLRIRRAEQQWEFVVPAGFTTRPQGAAAAAQPLLANLADTLARFFRVRGSAPAGSGGASGAAIADGTGAAAAGGVGTAGAPAGDSIEHASATVALPADYAAEAAARRAAAPLASSDDPLAVLDISRMLDDPSLASLPDFVAADDDVEAMLSKPAALALRDDLSAQQQQERLQGQPRTPQQWQQQQPSLVPRPQWQKSWRAWNNGAGALNGQQQPQQQPTAEAQAAPSSGEQPHAQGHAAPPAGDQRQHSVDGNGHRQANAPGSDHLQEAQQADALRSIAEELGPADWGCEEPKPWPGGKPTAKAVVQNGQPRTPALTPKPQAPILPPP